MAQATPAGGVAPQPAKASSIIKPDQHCRGFHLPTSHPMSIPVTFAPASAAEVQATMTVNLVRNDAI